MDHSLLSDPTCPCQARMAGIRREGDVETQQNPGDSRADFPAVPAGDTRTRRELAPSPAHGLPQPTGSIGHLLFFAGQRRTRRPISRCGETGPGDSVGAFCHGQFATQKQREIEDRDRRISSYCPTGAASSRGSVARAPRASVATTGVIHPGNGRTRPWGPGK